MWPLPLPFIFQKECPPGSRLSLRWPSPLPFRDRYAFSFVIILVFFRDACLTLLFLQDLDLSELLAFDPASIGSTILEANNSPSGLTSTADQLLRVKDLLSGPISALIQDSSAVKRILDEVNS
jgi:hypothetical protein